MDTDKNRMDNNEYWSRVKELLKQLGKTQAQLCKDTKIPIPTMKSWQANERIPGSIESVKIARELNTTVEFLITGKEPEVKDRSTEVIAAIEETLKQFK